MLKDEKGMALVPLVVTLFFLLALAGATIFMIGDGFFYNKDVRSNLPKQENNITIQNNSNETTSVNKMNSITSEPN